MEVGVRVEAENPISGEKRFCCHAYLTFVGLKQLGEPTPVPPVLPETDSEIRRYEEADLRRNERAARRKNAPPIKPIGTIVNRKFSIGFIDTPRTSRKQSLANNELANHNSGTGKPASESYSEVNTPVNAIKFA